MSEDRVPGVDTYCSSASSTASDSATTLPSCGIIKATASTTPMMPTVMNPNQERDVGTAISKEVQIRDNYISFGFTYVWSKDFPKPQCVCAKVLSHNSLKLLLLRRPLETNHAHLKDKPREFFDRQLGQFYTSKLCITAADNVDKKALEAWYMVSYRVANRQLWRT